MSNQSKKLKPRQQEKWIRLGDGTRNITTLESDTNKDVLPEPRQPDPFRSIENNIRFQIERKNLQVASKAIKKKISNGNQNGNNLSSITQNKNVVNCLAKALKRKAENQEIDE